jgi:hypothetical protein
MPNQDLLNYIQKKLERGSSMEEIKGILLGHGWQEELIDEAFIFLRLNTSPEKIEAPTPLAEEIKPLIQETITSTEKTKPNESDWETFPTLEKIFSEKLKTPQHEKPKAELLKETTKPSKKKLFAIIFIILLLIISGVSFAYYYSKEPLLVLSKTLDTAQTIKSMETESELKITIDDILLQEMNKDSDIEIDKEYTIKTNIAFDYLDIENIKSKETISALNDSVGAEIAFVNKIIYGRINKFDLDSTKYGLPIDQTIKDQFINKWIKITDLSKDNLYDEIKKNIQEAETTKIEITTLVKNHPNIIKSIKRLPGEKISGVNTHHYKIEIDTNEVIDAITEYSISKTGEQPEAEEINKLKQDINKYFSLNNYEIWIGKNDNFVYRVLLDLEIKGLGTEEEATTAGSVRFQLTSNMYNHNKPLTVSEPQEYINIEDLMMGLMSFGLGEASNSAKDAKIKADLDQMRSAAEIYKVYNDRYSSVNINSTTCDVAQTFVATNTDGDKACDDAFSQLPSGLLIRINNAKDSGAKYCIQKSLNTGGVFCVDYAGYAGSEGYCDSKNLDCKK